MSKTCVVYHRVDLDGWMSAAIVKKWFIEKYKNDYSIEDLNTFQNIGRVCNIDIKGLDKEYLTPELHFLGWHYGDEIPDLSDYDKVIMCDVSFSKEVMAELFGDVGCEDFVWIDHHLRTINEVEDYIFDLQDVADIGAALPEGLRDTKFAACELTWEFFFPSEEMPEIVRLLGRYDCFGHKGTDEEQRVLEFQYGARSIITNYVEAYDRLIKWSDNFVEYILEAGKAIYKHLYIEAQQIYTRAFGIKLKRLFKTAIEIKRQLESGTSMDNYNFLCVNHEKFNPVNFGIDYHKEGYDGFACFWFNGKNWQFSLYNDNGEVDCSEIAKQYGGGGHKGAAGFVCDEKIMFEIINTK